MKELDTAPRGRHGRRLVTAAGLVGGLLAGCGADLGPDAVDLEHGGALSPGAVVPSAPAIGGTLGPAGPASPAPPPVATDACPGTRWVATLDRGDCNDLKATGGPGGSYRSSRLFAVRPPGAVGGGRPDPLDRFCVLDWEPAPGSLTAPPVHAPVTSMRVRGLAPDCHVVSPVAAPVAESLREMPDVPVQLVNTFLVQAGALAGPPKGAAGQTRIAVIDSAPDFDTGGKAGKGRFLHGRALGRILRELTCPGDGSDPSCIGFVRNHLALPLVPPGIPDLNGGFYGSQTDLALAIVRALDDWLVGTVAGANKRVPLVMNLSLAWDAGRGYGGEYQSSAAELRGPAASVHAAITRAVCLGAAVIAAAGNRSGGTPETTGPMYPAAWESKPAPTAADCQPYIAAAGPLAPGVDPPRGGERPGNTLAPIPTVSYRPLVYAVGGVDGRDQPIAVTRLRGRPRLAAMAFHVAAPDREAGGFTDVFTGSSVSTAVVSAAAATVWGYVPHLPAAQVMRIVYESGMLIGPPTAADFCFGGGNLCPPIRRVSVCTAARLACSLYPGSCPTPPPPCAKEAPPNLGANPTWDSMVWDAAVARVDRVETEIGGAPPCTGPVCAPADHLPTNAAVPWVCPQPGWPGCDVCVVDETMGAGFGGDAGGVQPIALPSTSTGTVYISTVRDFEWTSAVVTIRDAGGVHSYDLTPTVHPGTGKRTFVVRGFVFTPPVLRATLSFKHGSGANAASTSEELLLWRR